MDKNEEFEAAFDEAKAHWESFNQDEAPAAFADGFEAGFGAAWELTKDALAGKLIDAWCAEKGGQIPWAKAIQIIAIVTKQSDEERDRLLKMGDEDGSCGFRAHGLALSQNRTL